MTTITEKPTATVTPIRPHGPWWQREPVEVQAVLDLAGLDPEVRRSVVALFAPAHADTLDEIAACLDGVARCEAGDPTVLDEWIDRGGWTAGDADMAQDELAGTLRSDALLSAQLVASLVGAR